MKRIADPVHGTIELSDLEVELLQTLTFQRLRGVKQLGLANLVFPGADYSRFSHCTGVSHITRGLIAGINRRETRITDRDAAMYRAAALLHDLGHYPFSHSMERAIEDHHKRSMTVQADDNGHEPPPERAPINHEELGSQLIALDVGEIRGVLERYEIDPQKIVAIIGHHVDAPPFANLVSSDLDADRIDYLMRTAHHTGLPYGLVDLEYLLAMVDVDNEGRICLDRRAMRTAEHLLLARYFDYQQVSYHKTVAGYEQVLEDVVGHMIDEHLLDCSAEAMLERAGDPASWMLFDDAYVTGLIRQFANDGTDAIGRAKAKALLTRSGPKMVWSKEFFAPRNQNESSFAPLKKILRDARPAIAAVAGLPQECVWIWAKPQDLTKIGSRIPVSRLVDADEEEEDALGQAVRILQDDGTSVPLQTCDSSIVSVLAEQRLLSLRVYALSPDGTPLDTDELRQIVESHTSF